MGETVLVTGGAGYVGSHVSKRLAADGFLPVALDDLSTGHAWAVRWGPLVQADAGDRRALCHAIAQYRPVAVMHFAGSTVVAESVREPLRYYRNNVAASLALLEAMGETGLAKLVYSSSAAVYGIPHGESLTEEHACAPVSPYGMTKLAVERVLADLAATRGLRAVSLRYFNAAGADPGGEIGEAHAPETHLIPRVLDAALGRSEAIEIYGEDHATPDGTALRDYVHVSDLADAHLRALRHLLEGGGVLTLNLGSGTGVSVRAVIEAARRVTGRPIATRSAPRRAGDPPALVADAGAAWRILSWQASSSTIERMLEDAWRWHRRHFGGWTG